MKHDSLHDLAQGSAGTATAMLAVVTSLQQQVEFWLRISSLLVGIAVGLATLWSLLRKRS